MSGGHVTIADRRWKKSNVAGNESVCTRTAMVVASLGQTAPIFPEAHQGVLLFSKSPLGPDQSLMKRRIARAGSMHVSLPE